jgi:hypothetical protein
VKLFAAALIALAAIGSVVAFAAAGDSTVGTALAIVLIGCAAVGAVSLAFLAIGEAEDRERAEAEAARGAAPGREASPGRDASPPPHAGGGPDHHERPRTLGLGPDRRARRPPRRPG